MKIGIDISQIAYQGSGIATYTQKLVENLLKIDKKNEYLLFGSSLRQKQKLKDFVAGLPQARAKIFSLPPLLLEKLWHDLHIWPVEKLIGQIDLFHSSDWLQPPAKARKVTTVHDVIAFKYPQSFTARGGHDIVANQKKRLKWVKKECDLIMADSQATKDDLVEILKISPKKIKVVYLAADESFQPQTKKKIKKILEKYQIKGDYLLSVGAREPRKNLQGVIEASALLDKDLVLVIVGKFGWGENLKIRKFENSKICFLGFVPSEDLPTLYSGAGCLVYPSFYEGFGLPLLEAMACGCPVVTSKRGSLAEIAGQAAVFVNPEKPVDIARGIKKAIESKSELIKKGLKQAQKFSWPKTAREVLGVYQEVFDAD